MTKEIISSILLVSMLSVFGTVWYFGWVVPNTERMYSIMDCMQEIDDQSQDGYTICAKRLGARR